MRWTSPEYLLLLPVLAGLLWWSWRLVSGLQRGRKITAFVLRGLLVLALVAALAGPQSRRPNQGEAVIFLLDRSDSIQEQERDRALKFIRDSIAAMDPEDRASVVSFGGRPAVELLPTGRPLIGAPRAQLDARATDMAAAIRLGTALIPEGKAPRLVLLTDGNETRGDAQQAAQVAATQGIPIDVVRLGVQSGTAEAWVTDVIVPNERQAGEPFQLRVEVNSTVRQEAILSLDRDGNVIERNRVTLNEGRTTFAFDQKVDAAGFLRYRVTLEPVKDADVRNNVGAAFVNVRDRSRVLVLQENTSRTELVTALQEAGLDVRLAGPSGVPTRSEDIQNYDAVILNDQNAQHWLPAQMQALQTAVRETGVGLIMVGGEDSFLSGGWYRTPIEEALPVSLDVRQRKTFPSTTVLIIADASGSMNAVEDGLRKIELAARAAEETAKLLSAVDRLGVAGSSDQIDFVAPMQELKDRNAVINNIRRLDTGGGGIYMQPSMEFGAEKLRAEDTKVRHLIILADGNDADEYGTTLQLARQLRNEKITTSVVAIGDGKDVGYLEDLAKAGGGNYYFVTQARRLPAIFTQDVAMMSRSAIEELTFVPRVMPGEEALNGIATNQIPALFAYNLAEPRPLARTSMKSTKDDVLLASWRYGLGTSYAFTSDAQSAWARRWVGWEGFVPFWSQMVRAVVRRGTTNDYDIQLRQDGGVARARILARTPNGEPAPVQPEDVRVSGPQGSTVTPEVIQVAPGEYEAVFPAADIGSYIVSVNEPTASGAASVSTSGLSVPYPAEYRSFRPNDPLLESIAKTTDGQMLSDARGAFRPSTKPGESIRDLWAWFLAFALALLPIDIAARRLVVPWNELTAWFRRQRGEETAPRPQMERLRAAKQRITPQTPSAPRPQTPLTPTTPASPMSEGPRPTPPATPSRPATPPPTGGGNQELAERLAQRRRERAQRQQKDQDKP